MLKLNDVDGPPRVPGATRPGRDRRRLSRRAGVTLPFWGGLVAVGAVLGGCGAGHRAAKGADRATTERSPAHEPCPVDEATDRVDADGDGRSEITTVRRAGKAVCQAIDLNHDGIADVWTFWDAGGRIRRREYAYGRDAAITEVQLFRGGTVTEIQQATMQAGHIDTWHFLTGGKLVRSERDSDGDGRIDEWWEYPNRARPDCPMMYEDADRDGVRDRSPGVDLCAAGYEPPRREEFRPRSPDFQRPDALPTEVEPAPAGAGQGGPDAR
jgi:hypothetical protein